MADTSLDHPFTFTEKEPSMESMADWVRVLSIRVRWPGMEGLPSLVG